MQRENLRQKLLKLVQWPFREWQFKNVIVGSVAVWLLGSRFSEESNVRISSSNSALQSMSQGPERPTVDHMLVICDDRGTLLYCEIQDVIKADLRAKVMSVCVTGKQKWVLCPPCDSSYFWAEHGHISWTLDGSRGWKWKGRGKDGNPKPQRRPGRL